MTSPASIVLLGSTDLTRAVAVHLRASGLPLAAVVSAPEEFPISYSAEAVRNSRYADMAAWCRESGVPHRTYSTPEDVVEASRHSGAAVALVAGWHHMVPRRVRESFPRGCIGVHASLLPKYRGGAPLNWALLNGDREAGVSLFELSDGVDDGMLYDQRRFPIHPGDYIGDLVCRAETLTLAMLTDAMPSVLNGSLQGRPQQGEASYALQRRPADGLIDWRRSAADIARLVRSTSRPYPGARTALEGMPLTIWRARRAPDAPHVFGVPGQIVRLPELPLPAIVTGEGLLLVEEIEGPDGFDGVALARHHQRRLDCHQE